MNTKDIARAIQDLPNARTIGVFAADRIPQKIDLPAAIIANTDEHYKPGQHWVAMYINSSGRGKYFDSYGVPPYSKHIIRSLRRNCKKYICNSKSFQSIDSEVCGQYCVFFLYCMCRGWSLKKFSSLFTNDSYNNDKIILRLYNKYVRNIKHYQRIRRNIKPFPDNNIGHGGIIQSCVSKRYVNQ